MTVQYHVCEACHIEDKLDKFERKTSLFKYLLGVVYQINFGSYASCSSRPRLISQATCYLRCASPLAPSTCSLSSLSIFGNN